jgi:hypothetical protein
VRTIVRQQNLKVFINEYYKNLFGAPLPKKIGMREEITHDISHLSFDGYLRPVANGGLP